MKVSVIVPVYNVIEFLTPCIESIVCQTLEDIEIICIDDGSLDGSGEKLDEFALRDERIKVIHTENRGYGRAMNTGIEAAQGEYIGIVESDDVILPEFYETLYDAAKKNELDIVKSEFFFWLSKENYSFRYHGAEREAYFGKVLSRDRLWLRTLFIMNTWTGLYRRSFLNDYNIRHHESRGASFQDNGFWMQGMIFAENVIFLDYAGYMYRQDNETASIRDVNKVYAMSDEYEWVADRLKGRVSDREMDVCNAYRLIRSYRNTYRIADEHKRRFCNRLISDYKKYGKVFFMDLAWQEAYGRILEDPDRFCNEIIASRSAAVNRLNHAGSIIIYGAGKRGEKVYRILCFYGWSGKLQCFVETGGTGKRTVGGTPVYNVDDTCVDYKNTIVIISAADGGKMAEDMRQITEKKNALDVMGSEELIDYFYMIC